MIVRESCEDTYRTHNRKKQVHFLNIISRFDLPKQSEEVIGLKVVVKMMIISVDLSMLFI